jgi:hypothetical protein
MAKRRKIDVKKYLTKSKLSFPEADRQAMVQKMMAASEEKLASDKSLKATNGLGWPWFRVISYAALLAVFVGVAINIFINESEFAADGAMASEAPLSADGLPQETVDRSSNDNLEDTGENLLERSRSDNDEAATEDAELIPNPLDNGFVPETETQSAPRIQSAPVVTEAPTSIQPNNQARSETAALPAEPRQDSVISRDQAAVTSESTEEPQQSFDLDQSVEEFSYADDSTSGIVGSLEEEAQELKLADTTSDISNAELDESEAQSELALRSEQAPGDGVRAAALEDEPVNDEFGAITGEDPNTIVNSASESIVAIPYPWFDEIERIVGTSDISNENEAEFATLSLANLYFVNLFSSDLIETETLDSTTLTLFSEAQVDSQGRTRSLGISAEIPEYSNLVQIREANGYFRILILKYYWNQYINKQINSTQITNIARQLFPINQIEITASLQKYF